MNKEEFLEEMEAWKEYCFDNFDNHDCYDDPYAKMEGYVFDSMVECLRNTEYKDSIAIFDEIRNRFNDEA